MCRLTLTREQRGESRNNRSVTQFVRFLSKVRVAHSVLVNLKMELDVDIKEADCQLQDGALYLMSTGEKSRLIQTMDVTLFTIQYNFIAK